LANRDIFIKMLYQRYVIDKTGSACCDVVSDRNSSVDESKRGGIDAGAEVATVSL
jgi:hypothetical protein